ncbi:MAG: DNA-binding protein [Lentisphaerae bacterium RIFOXYB12_FULL_65_16]|nr:MAG: DNA-binding protein [Lentisphaerae bacterium RIFOXYA12_64_32]OGV87363.1 MAG: DNA-binding protein [Lentisphaerae bacterium RIFOXYB12_FULL_65_16]
MTPYLLDVNVLLALCDSRHVHHENAHAWFATARKRGWATCPLTENAFVRIASQPKYPSNPGSPSVVAAILRQFCTDTAHCFWPDQITVLDFGLIDLKSVLSPAQLTDVYLLALAVRNKGKLATFDGGIPAPAVTGGASALERIPG